MPLVWAAPAWMLSACCFSSSTSQFAQPSLPLRKAASGLAIQTRKSPASLTDTIRETFTSQPCMRNDRTGNPWKAEQGEGGRRTVIQRHLLQRLPHPGQQWRVVHTGVHRRREHAGLLGRQVLDQTDLGYLGRVVRRHARAATGGSATVALVRASTAGSLPPLRFAVGRKVLMARKVPLTLV